MALSRSASNLAHNLMKGIREVSYMVTEPRRGRAAEADRAKVRLARETKHIAIDPAAAARGDDFSRAVIMARHRARELKGK